MVDFPNLTTTLVSPRNGFAVKYFDRGEGTVTPATQLWGFSEQVDDGFDIVETGLAAVFKGASTEFPDGVSIDEQVDEYLSDDDVLPGGCGVPRSQQAEITIDGQSGRIAECANHIEATVVVGERLYLFTLSHDRSDARAVFDAFVATIDLRPETAVDIPGLTTTFVSPTYGYSFGYIDREGLAPATELWDPVNQQLDHIDFDDRFDAVETGLAAYLEGASTETRTESRSMNGSTSTSRSAAAVSLAASKRRSPSMGNRAGSRSVRITRSRRPSSPAGGSMSSSSRPTAVTPGRSSTPGSPPSTSVRRLQRCPRCGRAVPRLSSRRRRGDAHDPGLRPDRALTSRGGSRSNLD